MKYRIVCAKPGKLEEQASYLYDNQTNEIWDAEGGLVDFRKDERYADFPTSKLSDRTVKEALQKYPEQSFAQKFGLCNR